MEARQAVGQASRAFFLSFRQWCIASVTLPACTQRQRTSHARTLSTTDHSNLPRVEKLQDDLSITKAHRGASRGSVWSVRRRQEGEVGRSYSRSAAVQHAGQTDSKLDSDLRQALRTLTRPCVVVTASEPGSNAWTGATLSSFDTISLDPVPQVSFNIKVPSRTYDALRGSGDVCVHILSASAKGALIADTFTKRYEDSSTPFGLLQKAGCTFTRGKHETAPKLYLEGGVLARLVCKRDELSQEIDVGDHKLCTLTVTSVEHTTTNNSQHNALAYGQREFRALGSAIVPDTSAELESAVERKQNVDDADLESSYRHGGTHASSSGYVNRPASTLTSSRDAQQAPARMSAAGFHTLTHMMSSINARRNPAPRAFIPNVPDTSGQQVSQEVMQQTVADFLCHSQTRAAPRTRQLRDARRLSLRALDELGQDDKAKVLTEKERRELRNIVTSNERFIARRLGHNAANDLLDMLDTGHISKSRIQYLEKCIEAGQTALLAEAKAFAAGVERKGFSKAGLPDDVDTFEQLDTHMRTVLMRLRDLHEEDDMD